MPKLLIAPADSALLTTSFKSEALSADFSVLVKIEALLLLNFLTPVPSSVPRFALATDITSLRSLA